MKSPFLREVTSDTLDGFGIDGKFKEEMVKLMTGEPFDDSEIDLRVLADRLNLQIGPVRLGKSTRLFD